MKISKDPIKRLKEGYNNGRRQIFEHWNNTRVLLFKTTLPGSDRNKLLRKLDRMEAYSLLFFAKYYPPID